ncbi:MAG: DNA replication/repair protein RecF [Hyphomicrobiales bacterium]|nr:MAG: DNA replication/repair protein RecF [Hyphomicrobiales bacterium]
MDDTGPDRDVVRVRLQALKLTDFRNYARLSLTLDGRHVVLAGENGAGKTNILEAISFLSPGRGLRRARLEDAVREGGGGGWAVAATLDADGDEVTLGTGLVAENGIAERSRRIRIDGTPARTSDDLLDHVRVLWLTPAMDGLFTGSSGDRRRFLDRLVLAIDREHGSRVVAFEKAMRERNRLFEEGRNEVAWFDGLEAQMAELGVAIAAARAELVASFNRLIAGHADPSSAFPHADLALQGTLEEEIAAAPAVDVEDAYRSRLAEHRYRDRAARRALEGPHRSDLAVVHGRKGMAAGRCSTGEQKALLLGLVLAHARLVDELTGRTPLLLLDEVAAHLDEHRRAGLFEVLDRLQVQAWMTGTDAALFAALDGRAQFLKVHEGSVEPAA